MKTLKNKDGAVLIEFAIVLPLLLILIFASIEFGILFFDKAMITNASREAARAGIVLTDDTPPYNNEDYVEGVALDYLRQGSGWRLITFGSVTEPVVNAPDPDSWSQGTPRTVTVSYTYDFLVLPNLAFFGAMGIPGTITIDAQSTMRLE